jgi:hypothetical protein
VDVHGSRLADGNDEHQQGEEAGGYGEIAHAHRIAAGYEAGVRAL